MFPLIACLASLSYFSWDWKMEKTDHNFLKKETNSWKSSSFKYFDNNVDTELLVSGNDNITVLLVYLVLLAMFSNYLNSRRHLSLLSQKVDSIISRIIYLSTTFVHVLTLLRYTCSYYFIYLYSTSHCNNFPFIDWVLVEDY